MNLKYDTCRFLCVIYGSVYFQCIKKLHSDLLCRLYLIHDCDDIDDDSWFEYLCKTSCT